MTIMNLIHGYLSNNRFYNKNLYLMSFIRLCPSFQIMEGKIYCDIKYLKRINFSFKNSSYIKYIDYEEILNRIFKKEYIIEDCQNIKINGHPDFKLTSKDKKKILYIEIKKGNDGLSYSQLKWIIDHSKDEVWVLFIKGIK